MGFGFPVGPQWSWFHVYYGADLHSDLITLYCSDCEIGWHDQSLEVLYFDLPADCHFCDEQLSETDQFQYQVEFENWIGDDEKLMLLDHDTFEDDPYPVCKWCRSSITKNQSALQEEKNRQETHDRRVMKIGIIVGILIFLFMVVMVGLVF